MKLIMAIPKDEVFYVCTADKEHIEMYLKAIWYIKEKKNPIRISTIAKMLNVKQSSVVQMLKKLNQKKLISYNRTYVELTPDGESIGANMIRNCRLLEVLMQNSLKVEINEEIGCGIEHHMNKQFTDALCTMLKHPKKCPHGHNIPNRICCTH